VEVGQSDTIAAVIQKVIDKEQLEYAMPAMYRLVRCGNNGVTRDGSEPTRATLPRVGVVDVLTRTVGDYGIIEGDILAMQVRLRPACRPALSAPRPVARAAAESGVCWCRTRWDSRWTRCAGRRSTRCADGGGVGTQPPRAGLESGRAPPFSWALTRMRRAHH